MKRRALALGALLLAACSGEPPADAAAGDVQRERAAALFQLGRPAAAREALAPLVGRGEAEAFDLFNAAAAAFAAGDAEATGRLLERAEDLEPGSARGAFLRGQLALEQGRPELAADHLRAALARAPADPASKLFLATALHESERLEEARSLLLELTALGFENGGAWYQSAVHRLGLVLVELGRADEAGPWLAIQRELAAEHRLPPDLRSGTLGRVEPPLSLIHI